MTKINQPKQPKTTAPAGKLGETTQRWNALVAEATKLGLKIPGVAIHVNNFGCTREAADKRIAWLAAQIEAKRPAPPVVVEPEPVAVEAPVVEDKKARKARLARERRAAAKKAEHMPKLAARRRAAEVRAAH